MNRAKHWARMIGVMGLPSVFIKLIPEGVEKLALVAWSLFACWLLKSGDPGLLSLAARALVLPFLGVVGLFVADFGVKEAPFFTDEELDACLLIGAGMSVPVLLVSMLSATAQGIASFVRLDRNLENDFNSLVGDLVERRDSFARMQGERFANRWYRVQLMLSLPTLVRAWIKGVLQKASGRTWPTRP